jgi:tRNA threonylcarbamoyladenosine biosynthesis protein TsaE
MPVFYCNQLSDLPQLAPEIIKAAGPYKVFALYGQMGAGKTTLVRALCQYLDVADHTSSPTFSIVNEYQTKNNKSVFHFDFYRINKQSEVYDLGYENYFFSGSYCFIEWPQQIENLLDMPYVKINIETNQLQRIITLNKIDE